jgi:large subunit ribosomal protein L2
MPIVKTKPTSPGRRFVVKVVSPELAQGPPLCTADRKADPHGWRNNMGRITTRHQGGGHKQHYRMVDFKRDKDNIPGAVERLEYDPNRSAHIALLLYADGERRYIIAPREVGAGATPDVRAGCTDQARQCVATAERADRQSVALH